VANQKPYSILYARIQGKRIAELEGTAGTYHRASEPKEAESRLRIGLQRAR
jgi:hypothetical protein